MEKTIYTCDVCGRTKQETNHWYQLAQTPPVYRHLVGAISVTGTIFMLVEWGCPTPDGFTITQHLCGAECVMKKLSEYLGIQR